MPDQSPSKRPTGVAVVVSKYNASITSRLLDGAVEEFRRQHGSAPDVYPASGSYELPAVALAAALSGRYAGVVALGCLIKGETRHDRVIADAVARGLMDITLQTGVPVAFGVLTVDTPKQAKARAGGDQGNKGRDAMAAVLETIATLRAIEDGVPSKRDIFAAAHDKAAPKKSRDAKLASKSSTKRHAGAAHAHRA